eukprot:scaffold119403_cov23-Prasinocladus_malaysianus.AAC.1
MDHGKVACDNPSENTDLPSTMCRSSDITSLFLDESTTLHFRLHDLKPTLTMTTMTTSAWDQR